MTVTENIKDAAETVKDAVGLGHGHHSAPSRRMRPSSQWHELHYAANNEMD